MTAPCIATPPIKGNIHASTIVSFPQGILSERAIIVDAVLVHGKVAFVFNTTPFHPVNADWPDQPADKGAMTLIATNQSFVVQDCQIFAIHPETQQICSIADLSREEKAHWHHIVAHITDTDLHSENISNLIGLEIKAEVDSDYRTRISLHHTACHLAAFALNAATAHFWKKHLPHQDSLGSPNLDRLSIESSSIFPDRVEDQYRFGKSIRKKGLQVDELLQNLDTIERSVNHALQTWIQSGAHVNIACEGAFLHSTRTWRCRLPTGIAEVPCGGSHIRSLSEFAQITYSLQKIASNEGNPEIRILACTTAVLKR